MAVTVDSHHHFWDTTDGRFTYPWMTGDAAALRGRYDPPKLRPLLGEAGIERTVVVQTISSVEETELLLDLADEVDYIAGVVGWVDLTDAGVSDAIGRLQARKGGRWLKGIRHQVHDEADPEWLDRADVRRGIAAVGAAGLAYDLLVRPRELPACLRLVADQPDVRFIVDHIAKPPIASGELEPWAGLMRRLAERPNVSVKVSGMVTEADWDAWTTRDLAPYVERLTAWYGPSRLMFGSDWPVCTLVTSYGSVQAAASELMASMSADERASFFGRTAARVYALELGPTPQ